MKAFMDDNFLLSTETAKTLFEACRELPIIDYHCHISPKEIWEDRKFENITQVWLGGDHYKWRLMRCAGVDEKYITGDADDHEKFLAWAKVLGKAIGNPLYHWSHLELQRFFGYNGTLNEHTAEEVWTLVNKRLQEPGFGARQMITMSNVDTLCTTDDPVDSLEWHEKIAADESFGTKVLPAWRPDKAMNIEKAGYTDYLDTLSKVSGQEIRNFEDLKKALQIRLDHFAAHGCRLSDHALNYVMCAPADDQEIAGIFERRLQGQIPDNEEQAKFRTAFLLYMAGEYTRRNWTMQLHYGCRRDNNLTMFEKLGPDTGYDTIDNHTPLAEAAAFLGMLEKAGNLPKTILYSLNPADNPGIDTLCGCFQNSEAVCKVQHGSAWWFNDTFQGMTDQLTSFANLGYLAGFVGMLTDSRSFLSYPRHEYFRRILCRLLGEWVEDGRYPADIETLKEIVCGISYENARNYFMF